jgi:hypothetical protein
VAEPAGFARALDADSGGAGRRAGAGLVRRGRARSRGRAADRLRRDDQPGVQREGERGGHLEEDIPLAFADRPKVAGGEGLAGLLRAGNAGSNTAKDHVTVLDRALAALPEQARPRPGDPGSPRVLARSDSAGATHLFAAACRERGVGFSFGFPVDERIQAIVDLIPDQCWHPAIEDDGLACLRHVEVSGRHCDVSAACRWARLCWAKRRLAGELPVTAPHARQPQVLPRPACTPAAIRAVLAAGAGNEVLRQYDEDLDAAFEQAREQGDLTPLVQTVRRWWFEADAWRDPDAQREFLARMDSYRNEGPPPAEQRMTREEIQARFGV